MATDVMRYYIAAHGDMHVGVKAGPGRFDAPEWQPVGEGEVTFYQVSEAIYRRWTESDDDDQC